MPSEIAVNLAKTVLAAANAAGTYIGHTDGRVINVLASQIDVAIDLVKESKGGFSDPHMLVFLLASKIVPIGAAAIPEENEMATCMVAISGMGLSLAKVAASAPTGIGIPVTALGLLADAYAAYDGCKGPAQQAYDAAATAYGDFMFRLEHNLMDWVNFQQQAFQ